MLFYESAKCLHGRLTQFKGKYYGGVFIHYQPVDKEVWNFQLDDVTYAVPPHWNQGTVEEQGSRWAGQVTGASDVDEHISLPSPIVHPCLFLDQHLRPQNFRQSFPSNPHASIILCRWSGHYNRQPLSNWVSSPHHQWQVHTRQEVPVRLLREPHANAATGTGRGAVITSP